jgi:uncharacterized membrane protein YdjX (TVP38/TMEM64 family)
MELITLITLFATMILQVVIPPIPAELIVIASGKLNGILLTTLFAGLGLFVGSIIVYYIGFYIHNKFERFFNKDKVVKIVDKINKHSTLLLWIRFLPYNPSDTISYAAGILKIDKKKFIAITMVTSFVRVFFLAVMGTFITNIKTGLIIGSLLIICAIVAYSITYKK